LLARGGVGLRKHAAAVVLAATALSSGCDSSEATSLRSDDARTKAPRRGGVFRFVTEAPSSLDPVSVDSVYDAAPVGQIFDGLVELDPV
jgi:ABC-type oligopeptide transport system substrate-binding subunit